LQPKDHAVANKLCKEHPQTHEQLFKHLDFEENLETGKTQELSTMLSKDGNPSKAVDSKAVVYEPAKKKAKSSSSDSSTDSDSDSSTSNDPTAASSKTRPNQLSDQAVTN